MGEGGVLNVQNAGFMSYEIFYTAGKPNVGCIGYQVVYNVGW